MEFAFIQEKESRLSQNEWMNFVHHLVTFLNIGLEKYNFGKDSRFVRQGQCYMEALSIVRPDLVKEIKGTGIDCYYDNKNIKYLQYYLNGGVLK
tara:strand:- start:37 stop:318 length:282 start_codon:yes stop_codon:yes gene_type:complete